jgi:CheY-like chemotaxis protein
LIFSVKDYGKGIEKHDFDVIFRPFQQASGAHVTESVYGGTGLGLAITKKLVTALGGTISVDSEMGCWSEFTVRLPCSDPPAPVQTLSRHLRDATVIVLGLCELQKDTILEVLKAFAVDVRQVATLDEIEPLVRRTGAISPDRRIMCVIHGEMIHREWLLSFREWQKQRNNGGLSLFTFGPHSTECQDLPPESAVMFHHIRCLEQVIPQALIEMLDDKSKMMHYSNHGGSDDGSSKGIGGDQTIKLVPHPSKAQGQRQKEEGMVAPVSYENLRILIAEDNKINQKVLMRMLSRLNVKSIDVVENGRDAVEREACTPYDVILMDQQMPVMGGVNACRLIVSRGDGSGSSSAADDDDDDSKSHHHHHPIPFIIFVTAHVSEDFEMECKAAGSSGFLPKPFKLDDIDKCLRDIAQKIEDQRQAKGFALINN